MAKKKIIKFSYKMKRETLEETHAMLYLGITITSKLSGNNHIEVIANATRVLNFMKWNLKRSPKLIKERERAYSTYVRSTAGYA